MTAYAPKMTALSPGIVPNVACINSASVPLEVDFDGLVATLQKFAETILFPVWGASAQVFKSERFVPGAWAMVFLDDANDQNTLGYHDLTPDGLPLSKIFVESTLKVAQKVSVTACHELAEMLIDPATNLVSTASTNRPTKTFYAYEICDAVEEEEFEVDGIPMCDFVYPSWFESFHRPGSTQFDYLKKIGRPFEILPGGYMPVFRRGKWTQIFGSKAKEKRFRREDRRGHRSTYRDHPRAKRSRPSP